MNATLTSPELTRADRCDRCGAAARVRAKLPSGAELLFCQHHANEHEAKLVELAAVIEVSAIDVLTDAPRRALRRVVAQRRECWSGHDRPAARQSKPSRHHIWRITERTLSKSWDDSIFSESAQAAFWCALSLPPLLLGMLGSLAYVAPLFGPETLPTIEDRLISTANSFFSPNVVNEIIEPTVRDIVHGCPRRGGVDRVRDLAVGRFVGGLGVRRLDRRGARPDAAAAPGAPAVLRAGAVRGDAGRSPS